MTFLLVYGSLFFSMPHDVAITLMVWAARHCIPLSHITAKTKCTKRNRLLFLTENMKWEPFQAHFSPPYRHYTCNSVVLGWYRVHTRGIAQKHVLLHPKTYFCRFPLHLVIIKAFRIQTCVAGWCKRKVHVLRRKRAYGVHRTVRISLEAVVGWCARLRNFW